MNNNHSYQQNQAQKQINPDFLEPLQIAGRCDSYKPQANGFIASSPLRPDKKPSLSIYYSNDGNKVHLKDHGNSGATEDEICQALGISRSQLFRFSYGHSKPISHFNTYQNRKGEKVDVVRYEGEDGKDIKAYPTGIKGKFYPLNHQHIGREGSIVIVEGEKCSDYIARFGYNATTWKGGAGNWKHTDFGCFKGRHCILWPDNAPDGIKAMNGLAFALDRLGCSISMVQIPDDKPPKWDVAGGRDSDGNDFPPASGDEILDLLTNAVKFDPLQGRYTLFSDVRREPVEWQIEDWLPTKAITLIAGDPGLGKSTLALKIASLVSTGGKWPDGTGVKQGEVIIYSGEDDYNNTVANRLDAMGFDENAVRHTASFPDEEGKLIPFNPAIHLPYVHNDLKRLKKTRLIILDPIKDLAKNVRNSFEDTQIRAALEPLLNLAREHNIAVIGITHLVKRHNSQGSTFLDRINGSGAWTQLARACWGVDHLDGEKALFRVKSNLGPDGGGFYFNTEQTRYNGIKTSKVELGDMFEGRVDDLLAESENKDTALDIANEFLVDWFNNLETGKGSSWQEIIEAAKPEGIGSRSLRRARDDLKAKRFIRTTKTGEHGTWFWLKN
ncbi:MAG: AAA family ATPase [Paracoccaceae bacterium]|nr:AAA family ATPase [Bacteroidota bacterium]MDE2674199.1 AAA family ATPase [Paracoccaceae bacterium]